MRLVKRYAPRAKESLLVAASTRSTGIGRIGPHAIGNARYGMWRQVGESMEVTHRSLARSQLLARIVPPPRGRALSEPSASRAGLWGAPADAYDPARYKFLHSMLDADACSSDS